MKEYKFKINDNSYTVVIKDVTDDAVLAEVNGKKHIVHIDTIANITPPTENRETTLINTPSPSPQLSSPVVSSDSGTIITPIPGQIISISVSQGDKIRTGQKLLILEAMKLENSITATMDGTVSEILVAEGDIVNQGQPLIVLV